MKLSCILPSYKDPLLHKTIDSILENSGLPDNEIEVIPILDGYVPETPIKKDDRIKVVALGRNSGMREAINAGVRASRGEFILRADEHNMFAPNFGNVLIDNFLSDNWIVTPRRKFLDPVKWEVMDIKPVDYMKLKIVHAGNDRKFSGVEWDRPNRKYDIDETFAMQGSCWIMKRSWWEQTIGELQTEGYGPHYQDSHEMVFKTWKNGGQLVVNKLTWHAHKHRDFPRTHNNGTKENPSNNEQCFAYALSVWEDYFHEVIEPRQNAEIEKDRNV